MARLIEIVSTSTGSHYILCGLNNNELCDFSWQLWITKYGARAVDWMQSTGMGFVTFMGGDLWLHNSDDVPRCNLFGEQKDCVVGIVGNEDATKVKVFDSLGIHSDGEWEVDTLVIPPTLNHPLGMSSKIPKEHFKRRGGVWRAQFLRNMKTNQTTESILDAIKGEELKGYELYMTLKNVNNPTGEQVKLFKVDVNSTFARM